jgi:hypothetical protein
MLRPNCYIIFAIVVGLFSCKEKQDKPSSESISEIVRDIAKTNVLMGSAVGIAAARTEQWDRYEALRLRATDKELLALTNDTNAVVRCYAFQALGERKINNLFPVILRHLSDTAMVHTLYGCLGGSQKVGDFFLETVAQWDSNSKNYRINEKGKATIDSLLLFEGSNKLDARNKLLAEIEPEERYYERIRQIATSEKNKISIVALAKYRKQQDKHLIEQLLKDPSSQTYSFAAVRNFPDASFFPVLKQTLRNEVSKNNGNNDERLQLLYQAIVQYKDQPSRQLLKSVLTETKGMQSIYHKDYLHLALKLYPASIYDGLLKPIFSGTPIK